MPLARDVIAAVARRMAEHAGLEAPGWVIEARVTARLAMLDLAPATYAALLESPGGASELAELVEAIRVGESRLFRHRLQIAALVETVVPAMRARALARRERVIRVWSAGCSTGEEPYTLAAVLRHALPDFAISILATDVSAEALEAAARASYPAAALDDVPAAWCEGFVVEEARAYPSPALAALVRLARDNLVDVGRAREAESFDLVWCRNVLIYFTQAARKRAIDRLVKATVPGGFVFVGYSESLRDIAELEAVRAGEAVYYTRRDRTAMRDPRPPTPAAGIPASASASWDVRTPPPMLLPLRPPTDDTLAVRGHANARAITAELTARLGIDGLRRLVVDLDPAELLGDDLAPVLRRARAAANAAGVELVVRATRTGARRWLARHGLDLDPTPEDAP